MAKATQTYKNDAIALFEAGYNPHQVSRRLQIGKTTAYDWWNAYKKNLQVGISEDSTTIQGEAA